MARPYSEDLRKRVVDAVLSGQSRHAVAKTYAVSVSFVVKLLQRWQVQKSYRPARFGGYKRPLLEAHRFKVEELIERAPDTTISELCEQLNAQGIKISRAAVGKYLQHLGLTYKKNAARQRTRAARRSGSAHSLSQVTGAS